MKKYRDNNGCLTMSIQELKTATHADAAEYYQIGNTYTHQGKEWVYKKQSGMSAEFVSDNGYTLTIPLDSLGTFLPDVASEGGELAMI